MNGGAFPFVFAAIAIAGCSPKATRPDDHAGHATPAASEHTGHGSAHASPSGYAAFELYTTKPGYVQLATERVEEREFDRRLRTSGIVGLDETRTSHVHPKVRGFIEGVQADFVGRKIKSGDPLCGIYSQEVFAAELEFLAILDRSGGPPPEGEFAGAERAAQRQLVEAARRRLALWDVPKAEVDRLEHTREAKKTFSLRAPRAGTIVAKQAIDGMYVDPSFELYTISDLSRTWVIADVYEADVSSVHVGDVAEIAIEGVAAPIKAPIAFLPPTLDEATRTLKVRFELDDQGGSVRPGAFANVTLDAKLGRALAVPEAAVVRTGTRAVVFVVHGAHVEPREIELGALVGDHYVVESGLSAGEEVATSAQFLLDSESRIRATSASSPRTGHVH